MSAAVCCRTCACRAENPRMFRSFALPSAAADSLLSLVHFVHTGVSRGDGLPQDVCPQCLLRLRSTRDFICQVRDAQDLLASMFPKDLEQDPINIQDPIIKTNIKEEPEDNAVYVTEDLLANASIECTYDTVERESDNVSHEGQNAKIVVKLDCELACPKYVNLELPVEYSRSDAKLDVNPNMMIRQEPLLEYEALKIECSKTPNLVSNNDILYLSKFDKWEQSKRTNGLDIEDCCAENSNSKVKKSNMNCGYETTFANYQLTKAKQANNQQLVVMERNEKNVAKYITKNEKIVSNNQEAERKINTDTNSPSTSKEASIIAEHIVQLKTNILYKVSKSETSIGYSYSPNNKDRIFPVPFYNGFLTASLDLPTNIVEASLPSWKDYFRCKRCKKNTKSAQKLLDHSMEEHTSCLPFKCYKCSVVILSRKHFFQHMYKHDKNLKQCCEFCGKHFVSTSDATSHKETKHPLVKKSFHCRLCDTGFDTNRELQCHQDTFIRRSKRRSVCDHCKQEFTLKSKLKKHMERHYPSKHICRICNNTFKSKYILQTHHNVHYPMVHYVCQVCGKGFKHKSPYTRHQIIHSDAKPHECDICQKTFKLLSQVNRHKKCHGPPLFKCGICTKEFRYQNCLKIHLRIHTNEKPYACDMCNKNFANWSNFNKHMKRIHSHNMAKSKPTNITFP